MSCTEKSRTRKTGDRIAQLKAQPRATASSWLSVNESPLPKNLLIRSFRDGTRVHPPTISIESISSTFILASRRACSKGIVARSSSGWTSCSSSSRFIMPDTSMSFMRDSMLIGACALADKIFFIFSQAAAVRTRALGFVLISILYFSFHSLAKCCISALSKSRPPKCLS